MIKKFIQIVAGILLTSILLVGCQSVNSAKAVTIEYTDGMGRTINLPSKPLKIISLAPSNTEILYAIGAGEQMVGRDEFSDYPAEALDLPSVGGSMGKYNLEQIVALQPDLVLAAEINTPEQIKALEDLKINVYYLANPTDFVGLFANLNTVGKLTGHEKESADLVASLQKRVDTITSAPKGEQLPKVLYELDGTDTAKPWTIGKGTFADMLITLAGGENIGSAAGEGWLQMSQEAILAANPDLIILGDSAYGVTAESVAARPGWDVTKAVQENAIYPFDDDLMSLPGPRLVDGLESIYKMLHP
jgi:iron complex transport system substrate-binding protein